MSLGSSPCRLIDLGCAYTSVVGSKRHMGAEKIDLPGSGLGGARCSPVKGALHFAGWPRLERHLVESCGCTGNKISLTGESAFMRIILFTWPSKISEEEHCQDWQMLGLCTSRLGLL